MIFFLNIPSGSETFACSDFIIIAFFPSEDTFNYAADYSS